MLARKVDLGRDKQEGKQPYPMGKGLSGIRIYTVKLES
jgi:hypothetical protein